MRRVSSVLAAGVAAVAVIAAWAGCSAFGGSDSSVQGTGDAGGSAGGDGSTDTADGSTELDGSLPGVTDAAVKLAPGDTVDAKGCVHRVVDFSSQAQGWIGGGTIALDGGSATLVGPMTNLVAAVYMPIIAGTKSVDAKFTLAVDGGAQGATFAWASNQDVPDLGDKDQGFGFCTTSPTSATASGFAFVFDVYGQRVSLLPSPGTNCMPQISKSQTINPVETASVHVEPGSAVGGFTGGINSTYGIDGGMPIRWVGFTASTGGAFGTFTVDHVTLTMCP